MKFFIYFVVALVAVLLLVRFVPSARINPVLPVNGPQHEVQGHGADVPPGPSTEGGHSEAEEEAEEAHSGAAIAPATPGAVYGAAVTRDGAIPVAALNKALGTKDSAQVKLIGTAAEVCQAKGCWMTLPTADGQQMRIKFKDYAFFVPKDLSGREVVVSGWAHRETVSVADQQHYLRDAGKPEKEIAAITQPRQELNFMADGVLIVK